MGVVQTKLSKRKLVVLAGLFLLLFLVEVLLAGLAWVRLPTVGHNGQFNLLILGIGGTGHEASDLTDTMMVLLANQKTKKFLLVSLPRDIWIDPLKTKINTLYHYGGFELVGRETTGILDQPIDETLLVDFKIFGEVIDSLGGIKIDVDHSFDDFYYPVPGKENDDCSGDPKLSCRYEYLHFDAGWQTMNGERALKFVRSRYAEGEEGTDFARTIRQQKVIFALKDKIFSSKTLGNPKRLWNLWQIVGKNTKTDLDQKDFLPLARFFSSFWPGTSLESIVLDGGALGGEGLLYHPKSHSSGQWVLLPVGGDWEKIQEYLNQKIKTKN